MTSANAKKVLDVMDYLEERVGGSCIKFRAVDDHHGDYVLITAGGGGECASVNCCSELGRTGSRPYQVLNLEPRKCMQNSIVVHELLHTLGTVGNLCKLAPFLFQVLFMNITDPIEIDI